MVHALQFEYSDEGSPCTNGKYVKVALDTLDCAVLLTLLHLLF